MIITNVWELQKSVILMWNKLGVELSGWVSVLGLTISVLATYYGIKAVKVTYHIYERQKKDSDDQNRLESYRNNPYFIIELGGLVEYTLEGLEINEDIERYIKPVDKYFIDKVKEFDFTLTNVGFNWAKILGVRYKAKVVYEDIDKFNDRFRGITGKDVVKVNEDGTVIVTIGDRKEVFFKGIKCGSLGLYRRREEYSGQSYNLRAGESFIKLLMLKEKISKLEEYGIEEKYLGGVTPYLFNIEIEVEYINSGIETESIKEDIYIGMRRYGGEIRIDNKTNYTYGYRYTFERIDKYNDLLEHNERKLKREDGCQDNRSKGQKEIEKFKNR